MQRAESSRVWVTGAGGLIGHQLVGLAPAAFPTGAVIPLLRANLDLTDHAAVTARFRAEAPAAIIHGAALSRSPACQADPRLARQLNVEVTRRLAELAADIPFVLLSTDLVFDGRQGNYAEDDAVGPLSVYAETKVEAEAITRAHPHHLIIRTSLNYGTSPTGDRSFAEELANAWRAGRTTSLFDDEYRCPIAASETARAIWGLLQAGSRGTFHVAGRERLSRWQIGRLVATQHPELNARITASSLKTFQGAPRPADVSLDCAKAERTLGYALPKFTEWLEREK
ncbi:MAG TPA: SDR family oxidoreductase [Candidatus Limnocylindria bacterium]|nr:SDR family oxidoreductase [Candidatus Limnocylindria bacterium]